MIKKILTIIAIGVASQAAAITINILPGQLEGKLSASALDTELVIEGQADVRDLNVLRKLKGNVATLDLSKSNITELYANSPVHLGKSVFKANRLPSYIFFQAPYRTIILPASISVIESGALAGSEIESIIIPEGVTSIGDYAFFGCHNLKSVTLPESLLSVGRGAFADCPALVSINLADTRVVSIPDECLSGAVSLRFLELPSVRTIGSRAFAGSGVESLDLPEVTSFAPYALADMHRLIILNAGAQAKFGVGTLMNCTSLVAIKGQPESIPDLYVANCANLAADNMISNATGIGKYAFANSQAPTMVLGPNLSVIDKKAFMGAVNLLHIDATALNDNLPDIEEDAFAGIEPGNVELKVADYKEDLWRSHPVWGKFNIISDATVGVDKAEVSLEGIRIRLIGKTLNIEASSPISSGAIYDTSGSLLLNMPTGEMSVSIDLSEITSGICIVSVKTGEEFKGFKIVI